MANTREEDKQDFLSPRDLYKQMLAMIGKGTGNGQAIRDEILVILRRHGLKEMWHRHLGPKTSVGLKMNYYEEWHQKLHNNTTPEDIPICEALIIFVNSNGDMGQYWAHLTKFGIDKKKLASYDRPITMEPWFRADLMYDVGNMAGTLEHYLKTLKSVHSSDDLNMFLDEARQHVPGDTQSLMNDLQSNFKDHDALR
jgi:alpha-glucan,water dikinase